MLLDGAIADSGALPPVLDGPIEPPVRAKRGARRACAAPARKAGGPRDHSVPLLALVASAPERADDTLVLAATLQVACRPATAYALARALIDHYGSLARAVAASDDELRRVAGLSLRQVGALRAIRAAALRLLAFDLRHRPILSAWDKLMDYLIAQLAHEPVEQLRVLHLDSRNRLIADLCHARGTINHIPAYPREIIKAALDAHACGIILVHNHPSGDPTPSRTDIELTRETAFACKVMGITLHDHLIIGRGTWHSLRQAGVI